MQRHASTSTGHLAIHSDEKVEEPGDPRISPPLRATDDEIERGLASQFSDQLPHHHHGSPFPSDPEKQDQFPPKQEQSPRSTIVGTNEPEPSERKDDSQGPLYVEYDKDDPRNPMNFSYTKKWTITLVACIFTALSAASSSTYNQGFASMTRDLHCTTYQATIGLSMYCLGFGVVPLVTASLSEEFGRMPLYVVSAAGFALTHMMIALAKNIETVIVGRFLNGAFGSTGATMVGGTIADIWASRERGLPMSIYSISAMGSIGIGAVSAAWIEVNPHLQWRWIQWIHMIVTGVYTLAIPILLRETRSGVLLTRLARKLRRETGDHRYRARVEDERGSLRNLVWISCTRPLYLLATEPVVISFSVWIGFAWGLLYGLVDSIAPVFRELHHFSTGLIGTVFLSITVGSILGLLTNSLFQERLYRRNVAQRGPEARLYGACVAAVLFPAGMFIYAWSSFSFVPWIALVIGIVVFIWATFVIYAAVFSYLADCYGPFASSALAGQSLARNIMGTAFPLFTIQLYNALSYKWANTLFALIAVLMIPIPYILFFYGPRIRARSKFASQVMKQ